MLSIPVKRENACSSAFEYSTVPFLAAVVLCTCHLSVLEIYGAILPKSIPIMLTLEVNGIWF